MYKRILSIVLVMLMCLTLLPISAAASGSVEATYSDGVVTVAGTGFTSGTSYTVRVVDSVNSTVKAMGQIIADGSGSISVSITTGVLETLRNYVVYINNPDGTLAGSVSSIQDNTVLYTATIQAGTGGRITSGTSGSYASGDTITLEASANSGYTFDKWTSSGGGKFENAYSASTTFIMPAANITITANFTYTGGGGSVETPTPIPTPTPEPDITEDGNVTTVSTLVKTTTDPTTGAVTANVEASAFSSLIDGAKEAEASKQKAIVEIKVDITTDTKSVEVIIPGDVFKQAADTTEADVKVDAGLGTITFDNRAVEYISGTEITEDISISIEKIDTSTLPQEAREKVGDRPVFDFSVRAGDTKISQFGGGTARISIPYIPKVGEDLNAIVVYHVTDEGELVMITGCTYDPETGRLNFQLDHFSKYAVGYNKVEFTDTERSWAVDYITYMAARNIINGDGTGKYLPNNNVTRAEFTKMLAGIAGIGKAGYKSSGFQDVDEGAWYAPYVAWAAEKGIVKGFGNGLFGPNDYVTREQIALMITRFAAARDYALPSNAEPVKFADSDKVSSYAREAVEQVQKAGIVNGRTAEGGTVFAPLDNADRAEAAKMLAILMQYMVK
jgi:uncharacterized repeat protein (TIGR02543 family)